MFYLRFLILTLSFNLITSSTRGNGDLGTLITTQFQLAIKEMTISLQSIALDSLKVAEIWASKNFLTLNSI